MNRLRTSMLVALTTVGLVLALSSSAAGQGPYTAQVSAAIRAILTSAQTVTGTWTFSAVTSALYNTTTNCSDSAGDAACTAAPAGSFVIDAADTDTVVSTTAVTANSQIHIQEDSSLGTRLSVTCNTTIARLFVVTSRVAATSFTVTASAAPVTNPACLSFRIVN